MRTKCEIKNGSVRTESVMAAPIATPQTFNSEWTVAVERYRPLLVIAGHDHQTPKRFNTWHSKLASTVCVNVGQEHSTLHYCVIDFEFKSPDQKLPDKITMRAFLWNQELEIAPG